VDKCAQWNLWHAGLLPLGHRSAQAAPRFIRTPAADGRPPSRPFVSKEIEAGRLMHRMVGSHRRIAFEDLVAYARQMREKQVAALDELAANAQDSLCRKPAGTAESRLVEKEACRQQHATQRALLNSPCLTPRYICTTSRSAFLPPLYEKIEMAPCFRSPCALKVVSPITP
jgi:hypothetical protein